MTNKLATMLKEIRVTQGHSLRTVEKETGISNAYLSQLERGDAENPSPDKLYALAEFYKVPYMDLMKAAGYVQKTSMKGSDVSSAQAALMSANLTPEEEQSVLKYIQFLRFQDKKK